MIDALLQTVCNSYNGHLQWISQKPGSLKSRNIIQLLVKLAATLFADFIAVHPFSDGNGRLGRILWEAWQNSYGPCASCSCTVPRHLLFAGCISV